MYKYIQTVTRKSIRCNCCHKKLADTLTVANFNHPCYGKIKKYANYTRHGKNVFICTECE